MTSLTKNVIKKVVDFKRFTVCNTEGKHLFKDGEIEGNSLASFISKKKSFIVTKRKVNRSIMEDSSFRSESKKSGN